MPTFHATTIGRGVVLRTPNATGSEGQAMVLAADGKTLEFADLAGGAESPLTLTAGDATETPLTVEAADGQTAHLQQWENAAGAAQARITSAGYFSHPVGSSLNEVFGVEASASVNGRAAAFGRGANAQGNRSTAIGWFSQAAGERSTAIGSGARILSAAGSSVAIGESAGTGASSTPENYICIGKSSSPTLLSNVCVIGSGDVPMNDVFIGKGIAHDSPNDVTYHATSGSGTDVAGGKHTIAGGRGTGSGNGGNVSLAVALPGSSGSSLNTLADKLTVRGSDGLIVLDVPTSDPSVAGALWCDTAADRALKVSAG